MVLNRCPYCTTEVLEQCFANEALVDEPRSISCNQTRHATSQPARQLAGQPAAQPASPPMSSNIAKQYCLAIVNVKQFDKDHYNLVDIATDC